MASTRGAARAIDELYRSAMGDAVKPYEFQRRVAEDGLPELLDVPTGCGKTPAMLLGWLFRRRLHSDVSVRQSTPRRLVWCLPLRTLVDQTRDLAGRWLGAAGHADVKVYTLLGGEPTRDQEWRLAPDDDCVIIGTLDMLLSRALNRGYLASRFAWPIDFALFNNDCHWVFDEVQLMDVALATSRQLHGLRRRFDVALPCGSTWMSATIDREELQTIDAPDIDDVVGIERSEIDDRLAARLDAPKTLLRMEATDSKRFAAVFADAVVSEHQPGTFTLAVVNTVADAREVHRRVTKAVAEEVLLIHSRFRPLDRAEVLRKVMACGEGSEGIVVSTQVIEAGVDLSANTLVTENAPWSSITQRAGRCNRWGEVASARLIVVRNPHAKNHPYDPASLDAAWAACEALDTTTVTPQILATQHIDENAQPHAVLRSRDLLDLFDTAPDLSGGDVDVSRFIRLDGNLDLAVAWRPFYAEIGPDDDSPLPTRDERCSVPCNAARDWLGQQVRGAWVEDPIGGDGRGTSHRGGPRRWRRAQRSDLRPGVVVLVPSALGGYRADTGFDPKSTALVEVVTLVDEPLALPIDSDLSSDDEPLSTELGATVTLTQHLTDVEAAARVLCASFGFDPSRADRAAVIRAARLHDIGKAHPVWQRAIRNLSGDSDGPPLAKSGRKGRLRFDPPHFRHELASALALLDQRELVRAQDGDSGIDPDPDLVAYLVAAHHGRVRLSIRALPDEEEATILGVSDGSTLPPVDLGHSEITPEAVLSLDTARLGASHEGSLSWTARAIGLLDQHGPFRLAWLEMIVRIADWRASREEAGL